MLANLTGQGSVNPFPIRPYMNGRAATIGTVTTSGAMAPKGMVYNYREGQSLPRTRAAIRRQMAGGTPLRVLFIGNSNTAGIGSTDQRFTSIPEYTAQHLTTFGIPAVHDNVLGGVLNSGWGSAEYLAYCDAVVSGTWSQSTEPALGGQYFSIATADTTSSITFTTKTAGTYIDLVYVNLSGVNTLTWDIDSGTVTGSRDFNLAGTQGASGRGMKIFRISGLANTTHTVLLKRAVSGAFGVGIVGYICGDGTKAEILNAGWPGGRANSGGASNGLTRSAQAENPLGSNGGYKAMRDRGVDLVIIRGPRLNDEGGDLGTPATPTFYAQQIQSFITYFRPYADIMFSSEQQSGSVDVDVPATTQFLRSKLIQLCRAADVPFWDQFYDWATYTRLNAVGVMNDTLHPNEGLYSPEGYGWARLIANCR